MTDYTEQELELGIEIPATELSVADLVKDIVDGMTVAEWTPYQVHNVVNEAFKALGSSYAVRPQMIYNYDRNGMVVRGHKSKMRFTKEEVIAFVVRFVERNRNR